MPAKPAVPANPTAAKIPQDADNDKSNIDNASAFPIEDSGFKSRIRYSIPARAATTSVITPTEINALALIVPTSPIIAIDTDSDKSKADNAKAFGKAFST